MDFFPATVDPLGVVRHAVDIGESLDSHFDLTGIVKDTTVTVHMINNGIFAVIVRSVPKNGLVPGLEVGIIGYEGWKGLPFVRRSDESGAITSYSSNARA